MRVAAIVSDLMFFSRIDAAVASAGGSLVRVDDPAALPPPSSIDLVLVDWSERRPGWAPSLVAWREMRDAPRVILFGQHTDLAAHAEATAHRLGPMWARSKLIVELSAIVR